MLLNYLQIKEISRKNKYIELNENENITVKICETAKTKLRGKFTALNANIRKEEKSQ